MTVDRLYGQIDDETLHGDIDSAIEERVDHLTWNEEWTVETGATKVIEIVEFTTFPPGHSPGADIPDGAGLAEHIVERFWEDCGMEEGYEDLWHGAKDPAVIAAFQAARDLLLTHQNYSIADEVAAVHRYEITLTDEHGNWDCKEVPDAEVRG